MDPLPRNRNRGAAANLENTADGESSTSLISFQPMRDQESPPPSRRGCFPNSPQPERERELKRKVGCVLASTRTGRKRNIEKDYDFGLELGRGKFVVVRICKSKATGEELACKTIPKNTEENVYKEIEIMQHLSGHPNIVTLRAVYEDAESLHLVMELCTGGPLTDEMSRTGCYSEHQAANLIKELIMVIKYCHELGVVHRDIKPENVLRTSSGQLKLADFGLSMRFAKGQMLSGVVGSPSYVAPEVLAGTTYSEKVDVWGAGVLLHALLIGILPFRGGSIQAIFEAIKLVQLDFHSQVWRPISGLARDLLPRMLSRDVENRLSPQEVLTHPWIKFYTESNVKIPASIPYTDSNVKVPASIPKGQNRFLAVKGQCLKEIPLLLSSYKREKRAQLANSIPTEYGEDESFIGPLQGFSRLRQPEIDTQAAVDALAAAISQMRLSESNVKVPASIPYTESYVKIPAASIPYTESNVKIPASISKGKNCFLAVKGQCLEETPLLLSSYKREKRAQFANSISTEYGEDESFTGPLQGFSRLRQPEIDIQAAVDALPAAISQMRLSESNVKVPASIPYTESNVKIPAASIAYTDSNVKLPASIPKGKNCFLVVKGQCLEETPLLLSSYKMEREKRAQFANSIPTEYGEDESFIEPLQGFSRLRQPKIDIQAAVDALVAAISQMRLSESNVKFPASIPYMESNVKIPASIPKGKNGFLAVKGQCLEETPLLLSSYKREREKRAQFANSIPMEYGEDESFIGPLQGFSRLRQPEIDIQAAEICEIVDALAAAISQLRLSEPKKSRLCVPACPVPLQCSSHLKRSPCTAKHAIADCC